MAKTSILDSQPVKLFISVGGIWTSYIFYGVIMERLYKMDYSGLNRPKGYETFKFGFATSLFQHLFSFILAAFVQRTYFNQSKSKIDVKSQIKISAESFFSIFLSSQALAYVSFPIQAIMKSSKIISILIVSLALRIKGHHTTSQYICGVIVTVGILLFNFGDGGDKKHGGPEKETSIIGLGLLFISLFCDGLLGVSQQEVNKAYKPSSWDMMEVMNKWGGILCVAVAVVTGQLFGFIEFVKAYPAVWVDLIMISALGTIGQIFIFYTITNFSPFVLSIVTSTRKCFTLLFSILYFGHPMSIVQWISIGLVFLGVAIEILAKGKKKPEEKSDNSVKSNMEMPQIRKPTKGE